jgi:hypothetical protein
MTFITIKEEKIIGSNYIASDIFIKDLRKLLKSKLIISLTVLTSSNNLIFKDTNFVLGRLVNFTNEDNYYR